MAQKQNKGRMTRVWVWSIGFGGHALFSIVLDLHQRLLEYFEVCTLAETTAYIHRKWKEPQYCSDGWQGSLRLADTLRWAANISTADLCSVSFSEERCSPRHNRLIGKASQKKNYRYGPGCKEPTGLNWQATMRQESIFLEHFSNSYLMFSCIWTDTALASPLRVHSAIWRISVLIFLQLCCETDYFLRNWSGSDPFLSYSFLFHVATYLPSNSTPWTRERWVKVFGERKCFVGLMKSVLPGDSMQQILARQKETEAPQPNARRLMSQEFILLSLYVVIQTLPHFFQCTQGNSRQSSVLGDLGVFLWSFLRVTSFARLIHVDPWIRCTESFWEDTVLRRSSTAGSVFARIGSKQMECLGTWQVLYCFHNENSISGRDLHVKRAKRRCNLINFSSCVSSINIWLNGVSG